MVKDKRTFKLQCEWHKQLLNKTTYHKVGTSFAHDSSYKITILEEKQKANRRVSTTLLNFSIREYLSIQ